MSLCKFPVFKLPGIPFPPALPTFKLLLPFQLPDIGISLKLPTFKIPVIPFPPALPSFKFLLPFQFPNIGISLKLPTFKIPGIPFPPNLSISFKLPVLPLFFCPLDPS